MANVYCESCEELRENVPELITSGLTDEMKSSLENDTGLQPSVGNNDCEDLNNLNDCLIGNMAAELEKYDVCDWKQFMEEYATNDYVNNEALISAICGLWTQIHAIWDCLNS